MSNIYRTAEGDTFDLIALQYYGHERYASLIIQANLDYCDVLIFDAGVEMTLPEAPTATKATTLPPWRRSE